MTMQQTINGNLLKEAVGRAIFCKCGRCLDSRDAVYFEVPHLGSRTLAGIKCGACFDKWAAEGLGAILAPDEWLQSVIDGRKLWAPKPPAAPATPVRNAIHAGDVAVGKRYEIHHSSGWVTVRVARIRETWAFGRGCARKNYVCLNEKTGRYIVVKSAAKFRREVTSE